MEYYKISVFSVNETNVVSIYGVEDIECSSMRNKDCLLLIPVNQKEKSAFAARAM